MRPLLALLLLLLAAGCDRNVELAGATVVVDAPAPPAEAPAEAAPRLDVVDPLPNAFLGQVTAISDGDTLTVLDDSNTQHRNPAAGTPRRRAAVLR